MANNESLFPSIGSLATQTDEAVEGKDITPGDKVQAEDTEDKVVQEIDSLCMSCREQVREAGSIY